MGKQPSKWTPPADDEVIDQKPVMKAWTPPAEDEVVEPVKKKDLTVSEASSNEPSTTPGSVVSQEPGTKVEKPSGKSTESNWFTKLGDLLAAPVTAAVKGLVAAGTDMLPGMVSAGRAGSIDTNFDNLLAKNKAQIEGAATFSTGENFTGDQKKRAIDEYVKQVGPEQYQVEKDAYTIKQLRKKSDLLKYSDEQDIERQQTMGDTPQTTGQIKDIKTALQWLGGSAGNALGTAPAMIAGPVFPFLMEKGEAYKESLGAIQKQTGLTRDEILALDLDKSARENSDVSGAINTGLELAGGLLVFGKFLPKNIATKFLTKAMTSKFGAPVVAAMGEGVTESIQAMDTKLAEKMSTVDKDGKPVYADVFEAANAITPEEWKQIREEGYAGAAGGGGVSVVTGVAQGQQRAEKLADIKNQRAAKSQAINESKSVIKASDDEPNLEQAAKEIVQNAGTTTTQATGESVQQTPEGQVQQGTETPIQQSATETGQVGTGESATVLTVDQRKQNAIEKYKNIPDSELEQKQSLIDENFKNATPEEQDEFNDIDNELERREWRSVFDKPLSEVPKVIAGLMQKEKDQPNGYGSYIDKKDASESKQVVEKYSNPESISDQDVKKDFKDALMGRPSTWYADGLRLRESANLAAKRGIEMSELLAEVENEFIKDGYDAQTAKDVIAGYLAKINPVASEAKQSITTGETPSTPAPETKSPEAQVQEEQVSGQGVAIESIQKQIPTQELKPSKIGQLETGVISIPVTDDLYGHDAENVDPITAKREVTEPIHVYVDDINNPKIEIVDGNHRIAQARFNGDKEIKAIVHLSTGTSKQLQETTKETPSTSQEPDLTLGTNFQKVSGAWQVKQSDGSWAPVINKNATKAEQNQELKHLKEIQAQLEAQEPQNLKMSNTEKGRIAQLEPHTPEGAARKFFWSGGKALWGTSGKRRGIKEEGGLNEGDKELIGNHISDDGMSIDAIAEKISTENPNFSVDEAKQAVINILAHSDPKNWYAEQMQDEDPDYLSGAEQWYDERNRLSQQIAELESREEGITQQNKQLYENERRVNRGEPQEGAGEKTGQVSGEQGQEGEAVGEQQEASVLIRENGDEDKSRQAVKELDSLPLNRIEGLNMVQNQAKGTFVSTNKEGNKYEKDGKKAVRVKLRVKNPFVMTSWNILDQIERAIIKSRFPVNKAGEKANTKDDLDYDELDLLAEMVTEHFVNEGYDSIYFPEAEFGQEGEIVVFDRDNVEFIRDWTAYDEAIHQASQTVLNINFVPKANLINSNKPREDIARQRKLMKQLENLNSLIKCR